MPLGNTGEYLALSPMDRATLVETVVDEVAGRIPVVAGVVSPGFQEAVDAGMDFKKEVRMPLCSFLPILLRRLRRE